MRMVDAHPLLIERTSEALLRRGPWRTGVLLIALLGCAPATTTPTTAEPQASPNGAERACDVRVDAVLSAEAFRGYRSTPATRAAIDALSRENYEQWVAESHGASYLLCTYRVIVQGRAYRFEEAHDTTFEPREPAACEAARGAVADHIRAVTAGCTDLHRGAYYGADLQPVD